MRQRYAAIFLTLMYVMVLIRPALPYLLFTANEHYIQSDLCEQRTVKGNCCRGACFLRKNLEKDEQKRRPIQALFSQQSQSEQLPLTESIPAFFPSLESFDWHICLDNCGIDQYAHDLQAPPPWGFQTLS